MQSKYISLFEKGTFEKINNQFIVEGSDVLQELSNVQLKFDKEDTDTFINELRDSIVGYTLGFEMINIEKHGFDCKMSENRNIFLEVKSASFCSSQWVATFNDTTYEKAEAFKDKKLYLALAVWKEASNLLFICYGQNIKLGKFLEEKVRHFKSGATVRSTQSISLASLVFDYNFKILSINKTKDEILDILRYKSRTFYKLKKEDIISMDEFNGVCNDYIEFTLY